MEGTRRAPVLHLQEMAACFARQSDVVAAYLFGSVARGQAGPHSDVDVAVLLDPDLGPEAAVERQLQLMADLEHLADREIQLTVLNRASPTLAFQVVHDGHLLYERSRPDRIAFTVRAMKVYFDIQPMLEFHSQALMARIREVGLDGRTTHHPRALETAQRIRERLAGAAGR